MLAHTEKLNGIFTDPPLEIHTDEDKPDSSPTHISYTNISDSIIELNWKIPEKTNGIVLYYTVYYRNSTGEYSKNTR